MQKKYPWTATVLTLYPEAFPGVLGASIIGQALEHKKWHLNAVNIREFSTLKHSSVDDTPAGGGAGMVLRADVIARALDSIEQKNLSYLYLTPRGKPISQLRIKKLASDKGVVILCGRFEGVDQRVIEARKLEEVSLGDIVFAGGEIAAQGIIEACVRLLPGVLGSHHSIQEESYEKNLLEYPQYTRPRIWENRAIPEVLLSGDHQKIKAWRHKKAEETTKERRPDLWQKRLDQGDQS